MPAQEVTSHGVDALIDKLRNDGVAAGKAEAERLISEAETEAAKIVSAAKAEAASQLRKVRKAADSYTAAGEEALNIAMRDAVLSMKSGLMVQFELDVKRMVSASLADPDMLKQMVLELVGSAREATGAGKDTEVILPAEIVGTQAIRENPDDIQSGKLTKFVLGLTQQMLEDGVILHAADDLQGGIRARVKNKDIMLDLSDTAVASLLMQHLQPRFRAALEGVIK